MRAGRLRHRITIQVRSRTTDSMGAYTATWGDVCTVWASIDPITSSERMAELRLEEQITHKIWIRYYSDITTGHRIKFNDRYFNIRSIRNWRERDKDLEILATEEI